MPNLFTSVPKKIFTIVVAVNRKVSLSENAPRLIPSASVIAVSYIDLPLEQSPSVTQTTKKQIAIITQE